LIVENPTPTILLPLHRLRAYNPGKLTDEELKVLFVVRGDVLARIVDDVVAERDDSRPQHHLVVGQRGMGKTTLLLRIAAELRGPEHRARFIPLVFAEEQYTVDRLSKFWLNCLDSLADACEREGDAVSTKRIDEVVARLDRSKGRKPGEDAPVAREAHAALMEQAGLLGRRPVLLVDNLQLVFDRIGEQEHELRGAITVPGAPIFVAAAPQLPRQTQDYGAAFYDQFKTHYLNSLSVEEIGSVLRKLAEAAGNEEVPRNLDAHPARLRVLHQLAGGVPRTIVLLFHLFAGEFAPTVYEDLEKLLDEMTPLYKARFEDLSEQMQVIAAAMAEHWDPIDAKGLVEVTNLPTNLVSAQLDRLTNLGMVEKVELFGTKRDGFQIAERFFNVWLMMRGSSRRRRKQMEWLARFLETFYTPEQREVLARSLVCEGSLSGDRYAYGMALSDTLEDPYFREEFERNLTLKGLREEAREAARRFRELVDLDSLPVTVREFAEVRERLIRLLGKERAEKVLGDWRMWESGERNRLAERQELSQKELKTLDARLASNRHADVELHSEHSVHWLETRLAGGQLIGLHDPREWERSLVAAGENQQLIRVLLESLPERTGLRLPESQRFRLAMILRPKHSATAFEYLMYGWHAAIKLHRYIEAESAFKHVQELYPNLEFTWYGLGLLYHRYMSRFSEAETAYRRSIEIDPKNASSWYCLANLLRNHLNRYSEAEAAYQRTIEIDPTNGLAWNALGDLLQSHFARYSESEAAYRRAVELDPSLASAWNNYGNLLSTHLGRYTNADAAYCRAQSLDPSNPLPSLNRVSLLRDVLEDFAAAQELLDSTERGCLGTDSSLHTSIRLHRATFAAYECNWGVATEHLTAALDDEPGGPLPAIDEKLWCRTMAVLVHLGYGEPLLELLRERGDDDRLRPFYEGLRAVVGGDKRMLLNVAPEVRVTAERFYDLIEVRRQSLPEKTAAKKPGGAKKR
jgi:tetratricopeptide (TPR) repeat protein